MATIIADGLLVCTDCAHLIANDEATDAHRAKVAELDDPTSPGNWVLAGTTEDDDTDFSTAPCDSCGSGLAGWRTPAAILA